VIDELKKSPQFQKAMQELRKQHRPPVTHFKPERPNSVDEWKYQSGRQAGFDSLYSLLTGDTNE
jgi:hypothetical protein